eukprot:s2492_g5.t1
MIVHVSHHCATLQDPYEIHDQGDQAGDSELQAFLLEAHQKKEEMEHYNKENVDSKGTDVKSDDSPAEKPEAERAESEDAENQNADSDNAEEEPTRSRSRSRARLAMKALDIKMEKRSNSHWLLVGLSPGAPAIMADEEKAKTPPPEDVNGDDDTGTPAAPSVEPGTPKKKPSTSTTSAFKTPMKAKKAKAKASPKSPKTPKASPKAKSVMKKPKALKKPAAAKAPPAPKAKSGALKRPASKTEVDKTWSQGLAQAGSKKAKEETEDQEDPEEEHDFEQDTEVDFPEEGEERKTDRSKKQKFLAMVSNKELPDYILKEWERSKALKSGRTEVQRVLINSIFDRTSAGKLVLSLGKPQFETLKNSYKDTCAIQSNKALSKTLFMGKFNLTPELFRQGLQEGDFFENEDEDGRKTYSWVEKNQEIRVGDRNEFGSKASIEVSSQDAMKLNSISQNWKQGLFKASGPSSSSAGPLALQDSNASLTAAQWKQAVSQLEASMQAFDKCEKEALRYLQVIGVEKETLGKLRTCRQSLRHIYEWKEHMDSSKITQESYDETMLQAGKTAEEVDEDLAAVKGALTKRAQRAKSTK